MMEILSRVRKVKWQLEGPNPSKELAMQEANSIYQKLLDNNKNLSLEGKEMLERMKRGFGPDKDIIWDPRFLKTSSCTPLLEGIRKIARDVSEEEARALMSELSRPKWFQGMFSGDPVKKTLGVKDNQLRGGVEALVDPHIRRSLLLHKKRGLSSKTDASELAAIITRYINARGGIQE